MRLGARVWTLCAGAMLCACGIPNAPQGDGAGPAVDAASTDNVSSLRRIMQSAGTNFTALEGTQSPDTSAGLEWQGTENPFGLHCVVLQFPAATAARLNLAPEQSNQYACYTNDPIANTPTPNWPPDHVWALYDLLKAAWREAAPELTWREQPLKDDGETVVRSGANATGAVLYGVDANDETRVTMILAAAHDDFANGQLSINFSVAQPRHVAAASSTPPSATETRLTCTPTSGSVQIQFALDLQGGRVIGGDPPLFFPAGAPLTITDRQLEWPIGDQTAHVVLDRYSLELNETTASEVFPLIHLATCQTVPTPHRQL